jgi:purine-binding chemotaxis protein CheW
MNEKNAASEPSPAGGPGEGAGQVLAFRLGAEEYGVDILKVQEIKGWDGVTRVPYSPPFLLGVINLRGAIVPVIDLRVRFELANAPFDATTVIVVVRVPGPRGERTVGVVVDSVTEVHAIEARAIRPAPAMLGGAATSFLKGIASVAGRLVMLLDIEALVNASIGDEAEDDRRRSAA